MVEWLMQHGARVMMDHLGGTPLHDAAQHGHIQASPTLTINQLSALRL
jgi:hypothetical protein